MMKKVLITAALSLAVLAIAQESRSALAEGESWGWTLAGEFNGETAGFQGNDPGESVECPDGYLVVGGAIDWAWDGLARTVSGVSLRCRQVNEMGSNPNWMNSFYDWDAPVTTESWGSTAGYSPGSNGATDMIVEGFWILTRLGPLYKMSPWVNYHFSHFDFSEQSLDVQWDHSDDGLFAGSVIPSNLAPSNNDTASCTGSFFDIDVSMNGSPYTTLQAVRGLRVYRYTPAFSTQQRIGGFTVLCQTIERAALPTPPDGVFQSPSDGLSVSIPFGQAAVAPAGQNYSYKIDVSNESIETATGVNLVVKLDELSNFISVSSSRGDCLRSGTEVSCPLGAIASGGAATATLNFTAPVSSGMASDSISLTSATGELNPDQDSTHRTTIFFQSSNPVPGSLSVNLSDDTDPVSVGETFDYAITQSNEGSEDIGQVAVFTAVPDGAELASLSTTQGSCLVLSGSIVCSLGLIPAGSSETVSMGISAITAAGTIGNDVTVSGVSAAGNEWLVTASETTTVESPGAVRSISGSVRNESGTPIPNIPVILFSTSGSLVGEATSNNSGEYEFGELLPGHYLAAASPGQYSGPTKFLEAWFHQRQTKPHADKIDVTLNDAAGIDFSLRSQLRHAAYLGIVADVAENLISTDTHFGAVQAALGPDTVIIDPSGLGALSVGQRVAVLTRSAPLLGADIGHSEMALATQVTIVPITPRRNHQRGVVAAKANTGESTVVLDDGRSLQVGQEQAAGMTDGAHMVFVVHPAKDEEIGWVVGSVHSDTIQARLDTLLESASESMIGDAAAKLDALRLEHLAEVGVSTSETRTHAAEDIKEPLEAAIHAEEARQQQIEQAAQHDSDGETGGDSGGGGGGGHGGGHGG